MFQQNQTNATVFKVISKVIDIKTTRTGQVQATQEMTKGARNTQATGQTTLANSGQESGCDPDSENDQLGNDLLLTPN